jgi:hypothetical protein
VPAGAPGVELLRAELSALLDTGSYRKAADRLCAEILDQPAPPDVVARIEELV